MTTITVAFANPAREGSKWASVKVGDRYYSYDKNKLTLYKGKTYDIEFTSREDQDKGKTYYTITAAKEKASGDAADGGGDRWYMPFISNTVAHAIAANLITGPEHIGLWAKAAKQAAMELDRKATPRDDEPPEIE